MKKTQIQLHYDNEGDFLEIFLGSPKKGYFNDIGDDIFQRIDEKSGEIIGLAVFNFKKRTKNFKNINLSLPFELKV